MVFTCCAVCKACSDTFCMAGTSETVQECEGRNPERFTRSGRLESPNEGSFTWHCPYNRSA
eukprot:2130719-Alexandrium_andersonii.AAC.1